MEQEMMFDVTFITDYFLVTTCINAYEEEQAKRLAEAWLDENGLNISQFNIIDIKVEAGE